MPSVSYQFEMLPITAKTFRPFGKVIEYPGKEKKGRVRNLWRIVHKVDQAKGWRIAYLVLRDKTFGRLEQHPDSDETFEPISGEILLFVAKSPAIEDVKCFCLDRPIVLKKGVWHALVTVHDEAEIKITENAELQCVYHKLGKRYDPRIIGDIR